MDFFDLNRFQVSCVAIDPGDIARVNVTPEEETMQQAWMFKEDGNAEKVMLPWKYPIRKLAADITLTSGQTLHGHVVCPFFLETDDESKRFLLVKDQKGEKNQTLEDRIPPYESQIVLPNRKAGDGKLGTITIKASAVSPIAVNHEREMALEPPLTGVLPGKYDVFLFGEIWLYSLRAPAAMKYPKPIAS